MNAPQLEYAYLVPENDKKFVADEVVICCDCGNEGTTILTFGLYCRGCRSFRFFENKMKKEYHHLTGTILDLDWGDSMASTFVKQIMKKNVITIDIEKKYDLSDKSTWSKKQIKEEQIRTDKQIELLEKGIARR